MKPILFKSWRFRLIAAAVALIGIASAAFVPQGRQWMSRAAGRLGLSGPPPQRARTEHHHPAHSHEGHDHPGHDEASAVELSRQAEGNIGLKVMTVELSSFERTISLPGMVVERPGRSILRVTAPLTGVVTKIHTIQGEAVSPGTPLFELRLTHEELVQAQGELLRLLGELDVVKREVARLERVTESGAVAGKVLLERQYEQHKLEAAIEAQRQALLLHGLSPEQAEEIVSKRTLLRSLVVVAPAAPQDAAGAADRSLQVQTLDVEQGQHVTAGDSLSTLADHAELYIEGTAFEQDAVYLNRAAENGSEVTAVVESGGDAAEIIHGLRILYVANQVDAQSRGLHFYVRLPNRQVRKAESNGHRFISWQFKPGQRLRLRVAVETWTDQIVLPAPAVVEEGAETYVFQRFGDHFDRRSVRVIHRDPLSVVVAQDGALKPGDVVAASGAQQLHLALKNKSGGGIDPHAGHNH
jgi:multidrug efflux pump subunit AcrA (membrane-fusion protein)